MSETKDLYRIDTGVYHALRDWCLQYWENKLKIKHIMEVGGYKPFGTSRSPGSISDPTAAKALKLIEPEKFCEIVETTVKKVCADYDDAADIRGLLHLSDFILMNVTTFNKYNSYRSLKERGYNMPVGYDKFYLLRHKFFYVLNNYFKNSKN